MSSFGGLIRLGTVAAKDTSGPLTLPNRTENALQGHGTRINKPNVTLVTFVLDDSSSMIQIRTGNNPGDTIDGRAAVIRGVNESLQQFRTEAQKQSSNTAYIIGARGFRGPILEYGLAANIGDISSREYEPEGGTPLYDTIADAIKFSQDKCREIQARSIRCRQAFFILSDGLEQHSTRYDHESTRELITATERQPNTLIYGIGLGTDACDALRAIGISNVRDISARTDLSALFRQFTSMTTQNNWQQGSMHSFGGGLNRYE